MVAKGATLAGGHGQMEPAVYSLWSDVDESWLTLPSGEVFHTVFLSVAQAELHSVTKYYPKIQARLHFRVRELPLLVIEED